MQQSICEINRHQLPMYISIFGIAQYANEILDKLHRIVSDKMCENLVHFKRSKYSPRSLPWKSNTKRKERAITMGTKSIHQSYCIWPCFFIHRYANSARKSLSRTEISLPIEQPQHLLDDITTRPPDDGYTLHGNPLLREKIVALTISHKR